MRSYHRKIKEGTPRYGVHPWKIIEDTFLPDTNHHSETIFTLGNGYQGVRGILEEGYQGPRGTSTPGVYVNGLYFSKEYTYEEGVPEDPRKGQTLVNLMDWTKVIPMVDGEALNLLSSHIRDYSRILDLKKGLLLRRMTWITETGKCLHLEIIRLVSFTHQNATLISYRITPENFSGWVRICSLIQEKVSNHHYLQGEKVMALQEKVFFPEDYGLALTQEILHPSSYFNCTMLNRLTGQEELLEKRVQGWESGYQFQVYLSSGRDFFLKKYCYLDASLDEDPSLLTRRSIAGVLDLSQRGDETLFQEQEEFLTRYWDRAHVELGGNPVLQQGINYNLFQLLQSTGRGGKQCIAAKGLTGEFYEGHTFWDMEIYILPFYLYTWPQVARELLSFRYQILEESRKNARRFHDQGALFAWRTINGQEASPYFLGSSVQCHINAAVAYAIKAYHTNSGDDGFLLAQGGEILFETARYWAGRGDFSPRHRGKFVINVVCGPDEYKPGVNNNCYTNYMAAFNLEYALEVAQFLQQHYPDHFTRLKTRMGLEAQELLEWKRCAQNMYRPFDIKLGIHPQDDSFLSKEVLDVDSLTWDDIPLLRNWHPLVIWRYQVLKQADVLLLMFLLGHQFTLAEKKANFDYYEPLTTHDSSLSPSIYSIIASEIGYHQYAQMYLAQTIRLDLDDYNGNTYQGLHMANMGSSWMVVAFGLAGMRSVDGLLSFHPYCPRELTYYRFQIQFQGRSLQVTVQEDGVTYLLQSGEPLSILHRGKPLDVTPQKPTSVP